MRNRRWFIAGLVALPVTIALLFLMTRLILPGRDDPVVARMLHELELVRAPRAESRIQLPTYKRTPPQRPARVQPIRPQSSAGVETDAAAPVTTDTPASQHMDWQNLARQVIDETERDRLQRWLIENRHQDYTTIMQGPLPITDSVRATLPPTQEDATGYLNTYGDMEIKVSEHCVAQTQVAGRLDISDFSEKLPMRVTCKKAPKMKFSFDRD